MTKPNNSPLSWIFKRIKRYIPGIAFTTVLNSTVALCGIAMAFISKNLLDSSTDKSKWLFGAVLIGIIIFNLLLSALISAVNVRINGRIIMSMRRYMFSELVRKKYPLISKYHSGELLNRFTSDIDVITNAAVSAFPNAISMIVRIIAGISALFIIHPQIALIILIIGVAVPGFGRIISKKYKYMHKQVQETEGEARAFMQESFANIVVIKSFRSEAPILEKLNHYMEKNLRIKIKRNYISIVINVLLNGFFTVGYYGFMVWGAFNLGTTISYGTLNAFLQLIAQLRMPLQNVSGILPQYYQALASAERLMELTEIEKEPEQLDYLELEKLQDKFEYLSIENLAFAYEDELILKNCSFTVPKGSVTALTGESGCGKSTLFKLILGLYEPSGGKITINSIKTVDSSTRGLFSYVPQGNMILSGTLRENITMCNPNIKEKDIINAARAAEIYDYIETLPDGFETVLSERGSGLSEGQTQRLAIARALLFDAPVLLLDEATSALDEETETKVLSNIKSLTDKTVLFITHRNTSISICDRIVHAENGKFTVIK